MRLSGYNYNQPGDYFVTICTKKFACHFGDVVDEEVRLSDVGKIANKCWLEIPKHFENVELDGYIVMPNHVHGIVRILDSVGVADLRPLQNDKNTKEQFDRSKMLLSKIIHGFKSSVTCIIYKQNLRISFKWQRYYYDHIIETDEALDNIREYIRLNPLNWDNDRNNLNNIKIQI
jgi:REP element-mobilizing transposase RayT